MLRAAALLALLSPCALAQITAPGQPVSEPFASVAGLATAVPTELQAPVDVGRLLAEDEARGKSGPWRYGEVLPVRYSIEDSGAWSLGPNGERVWRLRIVAPGALSVSLEFDAWELPEGSSLFLYDDERRDVYGAYGAHNNKDDGRMAILPFPGESVTLEYVEPAEIEQPAALVIGSVIHGYRDVLGRIEEEDKSSGYAGSGGCNVDVNCPVASDWQDEKRSVCRTLSGGALCSGALINNSAQDGTQYLLTANHCGSMNGAIFLFNYERNGCGNGGTNSGQSVQGSSLMVSASSSDYRLVRVNQQIPASYGVYYAGWNRSSQAPSSTVGIHHPSGDVKKICFDDDSPLKSGSNWRVADWELGVTEGGSSGSPLFNNNGQIIGQLCCGQAFCGFVFNDYYGRLDLSWSGLRPFLDPNNSGAVSVDGWDPNGGGGPGGPSCAVDAYGAGSPAAQIGTLALPVQPQIGNTLTFTMQGFNGFIATGIFFGSLGQSSIPFGDATILVDTGATVISELFTTTFGVGSVPVLLPSSSSLIGLKLYFQAGVQDATFSSGWATTNGLEVTICG
ncbi:MAG: trypsin-like serine peptidase [Planctomycetota bacterium]|jgi:hypothetical protein